jgi:small-conductance mechanosensitive channel
MNWRMVMVETRDRFVLCIPNRAAAEQTVHNFTYPNPAVRITATIWFPHEENPTVIQDLLVRALADTPDILTHPGPYILYRGAKDGVAEYSMRYYIDNYKDKDSATEAIWKSVIDHISRSDFAISFPRQYLAIHGDGFPAAGVASIVDPSAAGGAPGRAGSER